MKYILKNGESIKSAFIKYHAHNPKVYEHFKKFARKMLETRGKLSSKWVINRIRWEKEVETNTRDFKINDAFSAHYARKFIKDFPQFEDKIELRKLRS